MRAEREIQFPADEQRLHGVLHLTRRPAALVVFVHGSGTTRHDPHDRRVARRLKQGGFGTLRVDLLNDYEARERYNVFDVDLQAQRLIDVVRWLRAAEPRCEALPFGYLASGVGTGVALIAAARAPELVSALVLRGGRPDTAGDWLRRLRAPTLFISGDARATPDWVGAAFDACAAEKARVFVPSASDLHTEPEALEAVAAHAGRWFARHLMQIKAPPGEARIMSS